MGHSEKDEKLNSLYLLLWSALDQFFPEDRQLDLVEPPHAGFRHLVSIIAIRRELFYSGKQVPNEVYGAGEKRRAELEDAYKQYKTLVEDLKESISVKLEEVKKAGVDSCNLEVAHRDSDRVVHLLRSYAWPGTDLASWRVETRKLKEEIASRALDYASKI